MAQAAQEERALAVVVAVVELVRRAETEGTVVLVLLLSPSSFRAEIIK